VTEDEISLDRIVSQILKIVGPEFVEQTNAAPFLAQIDQDTRSGFGNRLNRAMQLFAAITAPGAQHIAGEAFGMNPNQYARPFVDIAHDQGEMLFVILLCGIEAQLVLSILSRYARAYPVLNF